MSPHAFPPAIHGQFEYFLSLFGLWITVCLCAVEVRMASASIWVHRLPLDHPLTSNRLIKILYALVIIGLALPRAILFTRWPEFAMLGQQSVDANVNQWREVVRICEIVQAPLLLGAFLLHALSNRVIEARLNAPPPHINWQDRSRFRRGLWIAGCVFIIAALLTWFRP